MHKRTRMILIVASFGLMVVLLGFFYKPSFIEITSLNLRFRVITSLNNRRHNIPITLVIADSESAISFGEKFSLDWRQHHAKFVE